jgi:CRP-like cAMP-binding protein
MRFAVFANALNLFNDDANESVLSRIGTSDVFGQPSLFLDPRRLMIGAKFEF